MQILMNVWLSLLVIQVLHAQTHLDPTHVHATQDTVEMEYGAVVSSYIDCAHLVNQTHGRCWLYI